MIASIQGNFCGSPGLSDSVHGSGCFGHTKFFSMYFSVRSWKSVLKNESALFVICPLTYGENKIVQNADKIVH